MKRSALCIKGISETAELKQEIQDLVRAIVIIRDGGCLLRNVLGIPPCNGYAKTATSSCKPTTSSPAATAPL